MHKYKFSFTPITVHLLLLCAVSVMLLQPSVAGTISTKLSEGDKLAVIAERYFQGKLDLNPLEGTEATGDVKYEAELAIDIAPAHRLKRSALYQRVLQEQAALNVKFLSTADQLTKSLLEDELRTKLDWLRIPNDLLPIDQYGGLPVYVAQFGSGQDIQPLKTVENYRNYLKRLDRLPAWTEQAIINMRSGVKRGVVQPKVLIERGLPSLQALTSTDLNKSTFYLAIRNMPASFSASDRKALSAEYRQSIETRLVPAMNRLVEFLEKEYLPRCRLTAGFNALPNGKTLYELLVRLHTTTRLKPAQIHAIGLKEVARIRDEMEKVQATYRFEGTLNEFFKWHELRPENRPFKTEQEVLDAYAGLNRKIIDKLPQLFGRSPAAPLEIRAEPELTRATASDHYSPPAADGSRPGIFFAVIEDATQYSTTGMTSLFLHEGQPGHHYQLALQQEMALPKFRKHGWYSAYGEGWALYAETLGREMGLYDDPNAYMGHLSLELLRAVRLVTDTGLHSKGWTREQSIQYMMDAQGISESDARRATERYMAWPGQALAYKVGALKIQELRARAAAKQGTGFSLKDFHDQILSEGTLPLHLLELKINRWIG
jgi:uncharacterized protein (DUF885 family)